MNIVDPKKIPVTDLPLLVLTDDIRSFFNWATTAHTKGNYGHIMTMNEQWIYDSMMFSGFRRVPVSVYDKPSMIIKFWSVKCDQNQKEALLACVKEYAARPWIKRRYDPLGIIGQLLNIPMIQSPLGEYCSEVFGKFIKNYNHLKTSVAPIDPEFPLRKSPAALNRYMESRPDMYKIYGYVYPAG